MVCFNSYVTWVAASWMLRFWVCVAIPDTAETKIKPFQSGLQVKTFWWQKSRPVAEWLCLESVLKLLPSSVRCFSNCQGSLGRILFRPFLMFAKLANRYSKCLRLLSKKLGGWKATWAAAVECWQGSQDGFVWKLCTPTPNGFADHYPY